MTAATGSPTWSAATTATNWLNTIIAYRPGAPPRWSGTCRSACATRLSAASADGQILIIGGSTPAGASDAIYRFDPATGRVRQIGRLPHPITHAARRRSAPPCTWSGAGATPSTPRRRRSGPSIRSPGAVHAAGRLPAALSDTGVFTRRQRDRRRRRPDALGRDRVRGRRAGPRRRLARWTRRSAGPALHRDHVVGDPRQARPRLSGVRTGISRANWSITVRLKRREQIPALVPRRLDARQRVAGAAVLGEQRLAADGAGCSNRRIPP